MAENNLFEELRDALKDFKEFLDQHVSTIQPAVQALASLVPQINDLISSLADLLASLKAEIQNLDVSAIPGLSEVANFTDKVRTMLGTAKNLLPDKADEIDSVLSVADVVSGLPSLDDIKQEILDLLDACITHINSLKSA